MRVIKEEEGERWKINIRHIHRKELEEQEEDHLKQMEILKLKWEQRLENENEKWEQQEQQH